MRRRSNKWSDEQVKYLRYELICINGEENVLSMPGNNPLRSCLTNKELYATLIPLLRTILELSSSSSSSNHRHEMTGTAGTRPAANSNVPLLPLLHDNNNRIMRHRSCLSDVSSLVRGRINNIFSLKSVLDTENDETSDFKQDHQYAYLKSQANKNITVKYENDEEEANILMMDDIEDF